MSEKQTREPIKFMAGDTLEFTRSLPDYLPADGWSLAYVLTRRDTGEKLAACGSAADGDGHKISVADFAGGLDPGAYILTGSAALGAERHQIYYGELELTADLADGEATGPVLTEAQEMIASLRSSLKELYKQVFSETDIQRNKLVWNNQAQVLESLKYWKEMRLVEIQQERARNGRPTGRTSEPVFRII